MPKSCPLFILLLATASWSAFAFPLQAGQVWRAHVWEGEDAFVSEQSEWRAVVSAKRGRLVWFGSAAGGENLLYVPLEEPRPEDNLGGHRVWLGPQMEWQPRQWPPPREWEEAPPEAVFQEGGRLVLRLPPVAGQFPSVERTYSWDGDGALLLGARYCGNPEEAFQIVHILQLPRVAIVEAPFRPLQSLPRGFGLLAKHDRPFTTRFFTHRVGHVEVVDDRVLIQARVRDEKIGLHPAPLTAVVGAYQLILTPHAMEGVFLEAPEDGLLTQVWLDPAHGKVVEIEQLSPRLRPNPDGCARFVVRLKGERR